jgi:acetolactate synthase-1/2/3 large subunit
MECIAVVNEVSAGIAAEYFNVAQRGNKQRAFAMVTAGPGLTNMITSIAGAWLESRELLVVGGQARTNLLSPGDVRQIGHQEINGVAITEPVTKESIQMSKPFNRNEISDFCSASRNGRKGPVFLEICLDVSAMDYDAIPFVPKHNPPTLDLSGRNLELQIEPVISEIRAANRPLFLFGGGLSFDSVNNNREALEKIGIPIATTWNAADYWDYDSKIYAGRPNTYGMRWANAIIQQSDLVIAVGARLGLQQTGFNWEEFVPTGKIIQVDIDMAELKKSSPEVHLPIHADASQFLEKVISAIGNQNREEWVAFLAFVREALPIVEESNQIFDEYANPFKIVEELSSLCQPQDRVISCSSGGSYTSMMQAFRQHSGQLLTNNKALASMGYGLAGAIGTAVASAGKRVILVEGDGGFMQNLSELGTVKNRKMNIKMFIFVNKGYASIRISQRAYFSGNYLGCDDATGLGFPDWEKLFFAFDIPTVKVNKSLENASVEELFTYDGPAAFLIDIHEDQPFYPKVTSKIFSDGTMKSNPIHLMDPQISAELADQVFKYLPSNIR